MKKTYEMDMCHGPLFGKILRFAVPLILSGMLQILFNAADVIVVGHYSGNDALAAVGSTASLINLLINLFMGTSVGANVLVARYFGSKNEKAIHETVHTAITLALICGVIMLVLGIAISAPMLTLMGTPDNVLPYSVLYMRIYFIGMPALVVYNFGAAILRAVGDTKRPLYFLTAAGVINIIFNLIFVIVFKLGVAGVAIATTISQTISAVLVLLCLYRTTGVYRLEFRKLRLYKDKLLSILRIGLPAGIQGAMFNISNLLVQSSINSFGSIVMAGNTAANNVDGFLNVTSTAIQQTSLSFISQNMGAGEYKRVDKVLAECLALVIGVELVLGLGSYAIGGQLLHIFSPDAEVIKYGVIRMGFICAPYAICSVMDVLAGSLRGLGYSLLPTIVALLGICVFRVIWVTTIFKANHTLFMLYIIYPISWGITALVHGTIYLTAGRRRLKKGLA